MGRLFWKFFFIIWLAQMTTIMGVSLTFWLQHQTQNNNLSDIDRSPPASFMVESAALTLQYGGVEALRSLLSGKQRERVYVLDEQDHELLGRKVEADTLSHVHELMNAQDMPSALRKVQAADGHHYVLFMPKSEREHGRPPGPPPDEDRPAHDGKRPPPGEPHIPWVPIIAAMFGSIIFAALLARYFSRPIRHLRAAFEAAAKGDLGVRVGEEMGKRRDELADLGHNFDLMASHLGTLMDGQQRLLHDVSHELRSPLARLQAAIGLVRQQPDKLHDTLDRIERESTRMDKLVGELLTLSRLEAGVLNNMDEEINLHELVSEVVNDARFEAKASGHVVEYSPTCMATATGNAELLHRAIENVVRNAVKHSPAGSMVSVYDNLDAAAGRWRVQICDQGPGIPQGELAAIFEPFFRSNGSKSSDGHGLGLAIARRVVEAHKGNISAANQAGGGLCVEISIPVV